MSEPTPFTERLSPALRDAIAPDGPRGNVLPLLVKLEKHWSDEGDAILAALGADRARLVDAGRELARAIRADWPCVIERFLASADERLARATQHQPAAHEPWNWHQPAQPEHIDDDFSKRIELALFQRAGGAEQFADPSALRSAAVEWLGKHLDRLDPFDADPIGRPPWLALGAPPKICWLLQLTGIHYRGLWDAEGAPWRTQDCQTAARLGLPTLEMEGEWSNEICERESQLEALKYTYSPRWTLRLILDQALRDALEHAPWVKPLLDYHTCVAESRWLAGRLLEASFGTTWTATSRTDALALGREWQQWRFAAAPALSLWATEHGMKDKDVLSPGGFDQGDWESYYDFRIRGARPHPDLSLQIARVAMFAIHQLSQARREDSSTDNERSMEDCNTNMYLFRRFNRGWEVRYADERSVFPNSVGIQYVAELIRRQGEHVEATELQVLTGREGGKSDASRSNVDAARLCDASTVGESLQPVLDEDAMKAVAAERTRLEQSLDDARSTGDVDTFIEAEAALAGLKKHTANATFGGKSRRIKDPADKARRSVSLALQRAKADIAAELPKLGEHLDGALESGVQNRYLPTESIVWQVEG